MTCEEARELLLDVVYGEDVDLESSARFCRHLDGCEECSAEHRELTETRGLLADWQLPEAPETWFERPPPPSAALASSRVWQWTQKAAAIFLIAMGAVSLLRQIGVWPESRVVVSQPQLAEMVHDMILAGQEENWRVIGRALLEAKEDIEMRNRARLEMVGQEVEGLELRFVDALEENNRRMQTLVSSQE